MLRERVFRPGVGVSTADMRLARRSSPEMMEVIRPNTKKNLKPSEL